MLLNSCLLAYKWGEGGAGGGDIGKSIASINGDVNRYQISIGINDIS